MKRGIALFLVILPLSLAAQTAKKSTATKPKAPAPNYLKTPFDPLTASLGPNFVGHSFADAYNAHVLPPKGEYETTADYEKKKAGRPGGTYAFAVDLEKAGETSYNADRQQLDVKIRLDSAYRGTDLSGERVIPVGRKTLKRGEYVAENFFGAKRTIEEAVFETQVVYPTRELAQTDYVTFRLTIPVDQAKAIRENLGAAVVVSTDNVGQLTRGATTGATGIFAKEPKMDSPTDIVDSQQALQADLKQIWLYDKRDGTVLGRFDPYNDSQEVIEQKIAAEKAMIEREEKREAILKKLVPGLAAEKVYELVEFEHASEEKWVSSSKKRYVYPKHGLVVVLDMSARMAVDSVEKIPFKD